MKMLKSKKALSEVIAMIVLIAVTVAVSLAVAIWMGALTFSFTSTEQITYTGFTWTPKAGGNDTAITLYVKNTGSGTSTIASVEVDGFPLVIGTNYTISLATLPKGSSATIVITRTKPASAPYFISGIEYNFMVVTAKGNPFGPYTLTAP